MSDGQVKDKLITAQSLKYVYDKLDEDMSELQTYSMSLANNQITLTGSNGSTSSVTLPTASADTLGGIKVGENLSINNGVLSAAGGAYYGTCSTAANVTDKTVSLTNFTLNPLFNFSTKSLISLRLQ